MNTPLKINPGNGPPQHDDLDHVDYIRPRPAMASWLYWVAAYGEDEAKKRWQKCYGDEPLPNQENKAA